VVAFVTPNSFGEELALAPLAVASAATWWSSARADCAPGAHPVGQMGAVVSRSASRAAPDRRERGHVTTIRARNGVVVETVWGATRTTPAHRQSRSRAALPAVLALAVLTALAIAGPGTALVAGAAASAAVLAWSGTGGPHPASVGTAALVVVAAGVVTGGAPIALLAGVGLGAAAGVDLVERRIPTPIAHGTTIVSGIVVTASLLSEGNLRGLVTLWLSTATVVTIYAVLWLAGGVGFGDVRLAAATVSAAGAGLGYVAAMVMVPILVLPVIAIGWRLAGRPSPVPYGPALAAGWLVALSGLSS